MRRGAAIAAALILMPLAGCDRLPFGWGGDRPGTAADFPSANRPVAPVNSPRWTDEDTRDRLGEADDVMDRAGIASGMTVADIGAGEGYYTVRLAQRVGARFDVLLGLDQRAPVPFQHCCPALFSTDHPGRRTRMACGRQSLLLQR